MDGPTRKLSKQKRKLPKSCPNPLFLKWLEEWRDEAKSKESKLQYVYSKAISSLQKYPLPLESGSEATLLDGVGPGIAKRLDEELARHRRNLANNPNVVYDDVEETSICESNFLDLQVPPPPTMMSAGIPSSGTCSTSSTENVSQPKPKKKRKSSPREYVPDYRSGPYAIMIALLKASERNGYKGYMTKAELQQQAQPFTETSLTVPDPGSYYTAWSSMSTLIKKGLVVRSNHPPRFHLSDSGHILAYKLQTATGNENAAFGSPTFEGQSPSYEGLSPSTSRTFSSPVSPSLTTTTTTTTTTTKISNKLDKERAIPKKTTAKSRKPAATQPQTATTTNTIPLPETTTSKPYSKPTKDFLASYRYKTSGTEVIFNQCGSLKYWYVNSDGECVEKEDNAAVIIDDEISFGYLIKCKLCDLEVSGLQYKLDHSRSSQDGYVFAFLDSNCITQHNITVENTLATKKSRDDIDDEEMLMRPLFERLEGHIKDQDLCISTISKKKTEEKKRLENNSVSKPTESLPHAPKRTVTPQFELKPGSFEIILCVDFTEATGGAKSSRKEEMVKELRMNGVQFDVRKLNVGDFLWIAKEKMLPVPGQLVLPEQRELVLDYIVERKRMDDLCSSIKDGRFKEQKFRLLNSGLRHPVYLVEDFGSPNFLSMPMQTLEQAIVNTQVGQEFFVKRTRDIKESAAYLTLMTRYLQTVYSNKTLKAIKKEDMEFVSVDENQLNTFLMTFQELSDISLKNRVLTVGEVFGKQLLQIPGVAVEKAVSILETYPTLRHLLDDYEEQTTEKEKESLLSGLKYSKSERKIGPSVSKTVYQLYCKKGALS